MNLSNKEILEMILSANEEFSKKVQRMEELASQMEQSNQRYLSELKQTEIKVDNSGVKQSTEVFKNVVENANKSLERSQKGFNSILYCVVFCMIGLAALFFTFKYGIETKADIKEEYRKELSEKGQYNSPENAEFLRKFKKWIDENPKDSQNIIKKVDKMKMK